VIGSRGRNQIEGIYGQTNLPLLTREHKLSQLYAQAAHDTAHEGVISTLHRTRKKVWIIHGRALADAIKARCTECRLKEKKCLEQKMGPLPDHRVQVGTVFQSVAIDLFRPVEYQQHVKKRQTGKGWGVVFVCTTTSALHVEFMDTYSTDSFLMALRGFMSIRGTPQGSNRTGESSWWQPPSRLPPGTSRKSSSGPAEKVSSGHWCQREASTSTGRRRG
jgi:hypothetical protein